MMERAPLDYAADDGWSDDGAGHGRADGDTGPRPGALWQFLILVEVANYVVLRRQVGRARAEALMTDLCARLASSRPGAEAVLIARDTVEIRLAAHGRASLPPMLASFDDLATTVAETAGVRVFMELAIGVGAVGATHHDEVRLAEEAERALSQARSEGRPIVRDVRASATDVDAIALAHELKGAAARGEMVLCYQPKVHLRRQEIASVEALVRWHHPSRGLVMPGDFIPIAEQSHEIGHLTLWALRQVIADQQVMRTKGHDLRIFVNIAGTLLTDARFVRRACAMVEATDARIGFEITETSVIRDPDGAIANLKTFAEIGIVIAIDDYGAGLSSLAYLKQLPARELKIDKLFVTQLTSSHRDPLIVRSTIDLAHALEMEVCAEGVETHASLALLSVMGCDMVQGFLISRPVELEALLAFLAEDRHLNAAQDARSQLQRLGGRWQRG